MEEDGRDRGKEWRHGGSRKLGRYVGVWFRGDLFDGPILQGWEYGYSGRSGLAGKKELRIPTGRRSKAAATPFSVVITTR